jgi:hypothetical protein
MARELEGAGDGAPRRSCLCLGQRRSYRCDLQTFLQWTQIGGSDFRMPHRKSEGDGPEPWQ